MSEIKDAAGASLVSDACALYYHDPAFKDAFDREVIDYLNLRQRITLPVLMRFVGRMNKTRNVPWKPFALVREVARRSGEVQNAKRIAVR